MENDVPAAVALAAFATLRVPLQLVLEAVVTAGAVLFAAGALEVEAVNALMVEVSSTEAKASLSVFPACEALPTVFVLVGASEMSAVTVPVPVNPLESVAVTVRSREVCGFEGVHGQVHFPCKKPQLMGDVPGTESATELIVPPASEAVPLIING